MPPGMKAIYHRVRVNGTRSARSQWRDRAEERASNERINALTEKTKTDQKKQTIMDWFKSKVSNTRAVQSTSIPTCIQRDMKDNDTIDLTGNSSDTSCDEGPTTSVDSEGHWNECGIETNNSGHVPVIHFELGSEDRSGEDGVGLLHAPDTLRLNIIANPSIQTPQSKPPTSPTSPTISK